MRESTSSDTKLSTKETSRTIARALELESKDLDDDDDEEDTTAVPRTAWSVRAQCWAVLSGSAGSLPVFRPDMFQNVLDSFCSLN
jgi:hypothetical protein